MTGLEIAKTPSPLRQFVSGIAWTMAATGVERGVALGQTIIIARLLGIEAYGRYGLLFVTVGLVSSVAGLQLGLTATVHISRSRISEPSRAVAVVRLCEIVSAAMALGAFGVLWFYPSLFATALPGDGYSDALLLAGIMAVAGVVSGVQDSVLQGFEQFNTLAVIKTTTAVVGLGLVLMLGRPGDLASVLLPLALASIVRLGAVLVMKELLMRREGAHASLAAIWAARQVLWSVSLPSGLASLIGGLANWYGLVLITKLPSGLEEVAILTTGQQWRGMVLFATSVLASVAIPMMARMSESGDRAGVRKIHQLSLAANMLFGVGVVAVVGVATGPILAAYGKGFNGSHLVFWLMVASAVPMSYLNVLLQYLVSHGRMWLQLLQYGVSNAVLVIGYVISIAYWGSLGFAVTTLIVSAATALALDRWLREELAMGAAAECSSSGVAGSEQKLGKI